MITKKELDELVLKYETKSFIKDDPIQFAHLGKNKQEVELYGFISSLFAYGNRKVFIKKLDEIFNIAQYDIYNYILNGDFKVLNGIEYRFSKDYDIISIFEILHKLYNECRDLEELFSYSFDLFKNEENKYQLAFQSIIDYFYLNVSNTVGQGFYHMLPNPRNGGAMKRINMMLRWFVRKSEVDLGIWKFIHPKDLLIPLDVHVARVSRDMGLLNRKSNDFKSVLELTKNLAMFCKEDPIKYDFAMFAFGVELNSIKKKV